jgi:hypothetical protein
MPKYSKKSPEEQKKAEIIKLVQKYINRRNLSGPKLKAPDQAWQSFADEEWRKRRQDISQYEWDLKLLEIRIDDNIRRGCNEIPRYENLEIDVRQSAQAEWNKAISKLPPGQLELNHALFLVKKGAAHKPKPYEPSYQNFSVKTAVAAHNEWVRLITERYSKNSTENEEAERPLATNEQVTNEQATNEQAAASSSSAGNQNPHDLGLVLFQNFLQSFSPPNNDRTIDNTNEESSSVETRVPRHPSTS